MKKCCYILGLFLSIFAYTCRAGLKEQAEEGIYTLTNKGYQMDMQTMVYLDSVYLPLLAFINSMEINNSYDPKERKVSGFLFTKDSSYYLSLSNRKYKNILGQEKSFDENAAFMGEGEIFVSPSIIADMFSCVIKISNLRLSIQLEAKYQFPYLIKLLREKKYATISSEELENNTNFYPELYGRNWKVLDGGILDYTINMGQNGSNRTLPYRHYSLLNNIGLQLFGGEFIMNSGGSYLETSKEFNWDKRFRWRYSLGDNNWLTHISTGDISPASARAMGGSVGTASIGSMQGVQFSNELMQMPSVFENIRIEDKIEPGWTVELYSNEKFIDYKKTDNSGYYLFELPIRYGNTNVELKFYGPNGEFYNKTRIISVASEFLRFGEFKYSLSAGKTLNEKYLGVADVTMGLTSWLTGSVNFVKGYKEKTYDLSARTSLNLFNIFTLNTFFIPNQVLQNSTRFSHPWLGSYDITFSLFDKSLSNSGKSPVNIIEFSGGLPHIYIIPGNINFRIVRSTYLNSENYNIGCSAYFNFFGFTFSNNYTAFYLHNISQEYNANNNFSHSLNSTLDYSWYNKPKYLDWLGNTRFQIAVHSNLNTKKINNLNCGIQQNITRDINLSISYSKGFNENNSSNLNLGLNLNLPYIRMNSNGNYSYDGNYGINNDISGTMGFDSRNYDVFFSNNIGSSAGAGAANVRFFIDANDNGIYDKNEEIITGVDINVPNATVDRDKNSQTRKVYNLQPGGRYNFSVRKESFKNPMLVPKLTEFSFIADPNTYKNIDVPCYVSGIIEGSVFKNDGKERSGQSGVRIHIRKKDGLYKETIPVYSDGSFYKMGVPPGDYEAWVDTTQCNILEVKPDTKLLAFNVKTTADGDMVSGLNFELRTKEYFTKVDRIEKELKKKDEVEKNNTDNVSLTSLESTSEEREEAVESKSSNNENLIEAAQNLNYLETYTIVFPGAVNFAIGPEYSKYLDGLAAYCKKHTDYSVAIIGHTDGSGDLNSNMQSSKKRAQAVANYLSAKGVPPTKLLVKGEGALHPVASNATPDGRKKNRRVEIKLVK